MDNRIGTCSNCNGPVTDESPCIQRHCRRCGAVAVPAGEFGPVVPMQPAPGLGELRKQWPEPLSIIYDRPQPFWDRTALWCDTK